MEINRLLQRLSEADIEFEELQAILAKTRK